MDKAAVFVKSSSQILSSMQNLPGETGCFLFYLPGSAGGLSRAVSSYSRIICQRHMIIRLCALLAVLSFFPFKIWFAGPLQRGVVAPTQKHQARLFEPPKAAGPERFAWVTQSTGTDDNYRRMLVTMIKSLRWNGGTEEVLVLEDGQLSDEFRDELEGLGCKMLKVPEVPVPDHVAATVKEPRNVPNFVRLNMWLLTDYDRLIFIDADTLFLRDVSPIRALPCHSGVPQEMGTINGGMMVLCPQSQLGTAMMESLQNTPKGKRFPVAEQTFLSHFLWSKWRYVSTCYNARAMTYRPLWRSFIHKHMFFWPGRDICPLEQAILLHYNGQDKPWQANFTRASWYAPELLLPYQLALKLECPPKFRCPEGILQPEQHKRRKEGEEEAVGDVPVGVVGRPVRLGHKGRKVRMGGEVELVTPGWDWLQGLRNMQHSRGVVRGGNKSEEAGEAVSIGMKGSMAAEAAVKSQ